MMGPFLLLMGLLLLYIAARGKSTDFISALFTDVTKKAAQEEQTLGEKLGTFFKYHVWDQMTNAIIRGLPNIGIDFPGGGHIGLSKPDLQSTDPNNPNKKG